MTAAVLATAVAALGLGAATGPAVSAAPVSTTVKYSCGARPGAGAETQATLDQAAGLLLTNRLAVDVTVSAADIPERAGLEQDIDARFKWTASLDQALIDQAAALIPSIGLSNVSGSMNFGGPASESTFSGSGPNSNVRPQVGVRTALDLGTYGGPITTTGGGIITYRVGTLDFNARLDITGLGVRNLELRCSVTGTNLVARTSVRDPDAPIFDPDVISLEAAANETVTVDLLGDVITAGRTPLLPETLRIAEPPAGGSATIDANGQFSFTAPTEPGVYSSTIEVCGAPKPDGGQPGINEVQQLNLGDNWGGNLLSPRPIAFSLKVGEEETALIWTAERGLFPGLGFPLGPMPTPDNWAPENSGGLVNDYALLTSYKAPTAAQIQAQLEALPSIGAGNVEVTPVNGNPDRPDRVTGFTVTYVNERAEQDIGELTLGQWYSVPPQEVLDRINEQIGLLLDSGVLDGGGESEGPTPSEVLGAPPGVTFSPQEADAAIGDKLVASIIGGGPAVTEEEWAAWREIRIIGPLSDLAPQLITAINDLFPKKAEPLPVTQGEEPIPAPQLCAQGIIDVTVTEVADTTATPVGTAGGPDTDVGGIQQSPAGAGDGQGIGFVG